MKNKMKVSIGIPAHNEGKNIKNVLKDILEQKGKDFEIVEILVVCDSCTDNTQSEALSVKSKKIKITNDGIRLGKTYRLNQMFTKSKGEVLLMLDGDIRLDGKNVIKNVLTPFKRDEKVMLVGGNSMPVKPTSFFEKAVYSTFEVFLKSRLHINGGNNIFGCTGSILAIRDSFAKSIKIPKIINEDAYLYFAVIKKGFKFEYVNRAIVNYKLPKNIKDYLRQVFRSEPSAVTLELEDHFGSIVAKEFHRPIQLYLFYILISFIKNPLGVTFISLVNVFSKILIPHVSKNYKLEWFTAASTH